MAFEFVVPAGLGAGADYYWDCSPIWTIVGAGVGFAIFMASILKLAQSTIPTPHKAKQPQSPPPTEPPAE